MLNKAGGVLSIDKGGFVNSDKFYDYMLKILL